MRGFCNFYRHVIHFFSFLSSYLLCLSIVFFFPQLFPVKLNVFHKMVVFDLFGFCSKISIKLFYVFLKHFLFDVLRFPSFISSDAMGLCLYFLPAFFCQLCYFFGICYLLFLRNAIFSFLMCSSTVLDPESGSVSTDSSFLQFLICQE
jgi:hypothetical protein